MVKYFEIDLYDGKMRDITDDEDYLDEMLEYMKDFGAKPVKGTKGITAWTGEENMLVKMKIG